MVCGVFCENEKESEECTKSYGIITRENAVIYDITDNYGEICELVRRMNRYEVDPVHMYDVINDFLFEKYTVLIKPDKQR